MKLLVIVNHNVVGFSNMYALNTLYTLLVHSVLDKFYCFSHPVKCLSLIDRPEDELYRKSCFSFYIVFLIVFLSYIAFFFSFVF